MYAISRGRLIEEQGAVFDARNGHYNQVQHLRVQGETSKTQLAELLLEC